MCLVTVSIHFPMKGCVCAQSLLYDPRDCILQAPLSLEFSRQEYWRRLAIPTPGDLPDPGIEPTSLVSPALAGRLFTTAHLEKSPMKGYCI